MRDESATINALITLGERGEALRNMEVIGERKKVASVVPMTRHFGDGGLFWIFADLGSDKESRVRYFKFELTTNLEVSSD